jgi:hypothetical protein
MADISIGDTITVTRTEAEEPNIIDVDLWQAYRVINGVTEALPIDTLTAGDGITITEPVGDEGARTYAISWTHVIEGDVSDGDTYQILFVPGGTEAGMAGTLDWSSAEYNVVVVDSTAVQQSMAMVNGLIM